MIMRRFYCTTYCNFAHCLDTGDPIDHECINIPPLALQAEMNGDYDEAIRIMELSSEELEKLEEKI